MSESVAVLMYHQICNYPDPRFSEYTVTLKAFRRQMSWLKRAGYESVRVEELLAWRAGTANLPRRSVVITFDDGFAEAVAHAAPILEEHGLRGVFFIVAGLVGQPSHWLVREIGTDFPLADWHALRRLFANGHECGAHTLSHPRLSQLAPERCAQELSESRTLLEDGLQREIRDLAYPFGAHNDDTLAATEAAGFRTAFTTESRRCSREDPALALPRIHVSGRDSLLDFAGRLSLAATPREWLRTRSHAVRKRVRNAIRRPDPRR
jgi:peptidoglycan/xylan/chitin deacetylase (PgdA/CDA1 family)